MRPGRRPRRGRAGISEVRGGTWDSSRGRPSHVGQITSLCRSLRTISRPNTGTSVAAFLVLASSLAACRPAVRPQTPEAPTVPASTTAAPTATPTAWLLVGGGTPPEVQEAVSVWGNSNGLVVRVEPLAGQPQAVPAGLRAVVGNETEVLAVYDRWSQADISFVVLDPVSLGPSDKTSVIGPTVSYDHAGFLAGMAAGLATSFGGVGLSPGGGEANEAFAAGFEEGVRYACPKCRVEHVPEPMRPPFGVDVVGIAPDPVSLGGDEAIGAPWLIVIGDPEMGSWVNRLAARIREAPEMLVGPAIEHLLDGSPGEMWAYTGENGGLRVEVVDRRAISPGRERLLREAEARLASGVLVIGGGE